jgi:hypothetical protein
MMFDTLHRLRAEHTDEEVVQLAGADAHSSYALTLAQEEKTKAAIGLFDDLVSWAAKDSRFLRIGWITSAPGEDLGEHSTWRHSVWGVAR